MKSWKSSARIVVFPVSDTLHVFLLIGLSCLMVKILDAFLSANFIYTLIFFHLGEKLYLYNYKS